MFPTLCMSWFIKQFISCLFFPSRNSQNWRIFISVTMNWHRCHTYQSLFMSCTYKYDWFVNHNCGIATAADSCIHEFNINFSMFTAEQQDSSNNRWDILQGEHQLLRADQNGWGETWQESSRAGKLPVQLHLSEVSPCGLVQLKMTRVDCHLKGFLCKPK